MSRAPSTFKQRDVAAAIRAARQAGIEVARIEVTKDGKIVIISGAAVEPPPPGNEWDEVLTNQGDK